MNSAINCMLCRALFVAIMIAPPALYYGYPLIKQYGGKFSESSEPIEGHLLGPAENLPPCSSYLLQTSTGEVVTAYTPCPEETIRAEQSKQLDPATFPLRKAQVQASPVVTAAGSDDNATPSPTTSNIEEPPPGMSLSSPEQPTQSGSGEERQ